MPFTFLYDYIENSVSIISDADFEFARPAPPQCLARHTIPFIFATVSTRAKFTYATPKSLELTVSWGRASSHLPQAALLLHFQSIYALKRTAWLRDDFDCNDCTPTCHAHASVAFEFKLRYYIDDFQQETRKRHAAATIFRKRQCRLLLFPRQ